MVTDESFKKIDEFVVDDLRAGGGVGKLIFLLSVFVFGSVGEVRLLLECGLNVFEFGYVILLEAFPGLNGFEEDLTFFHGLLHVFYWKWFKEFVNL